MEAIISPCQPTAGMWDRGQTYARRLIEAGVEATLVEYAGLSHGFINMAAPLSAGRLALNQVGAALRLPW
jgi:acetyl esterase